MMQDQQPRPGVVVRSIQQAVKSNPGIHFRGLGRAANVTSAGQLRHHLDRLARQGLLIEVQDGRYKRFFCAGDHDPALRAEMARFSRAVPRRIAKLLLTTPMNRTQLRRSLGCADSTLGYHLTRMVTIGDLERNRGPNSCLYSLRSREQVGKILILQGSYDPPAPRSRPLPRPTAEDIPNPLRPHPELPAPATLLPPRREGLRPEALADRETPQGPRPGAEPGTDAGARSASTQARPGEGHGDGTAV